ncbi:hypothetical protein LTS10_009809 [Elasticomyces elasticus]|nr:hypothetical protein LTS10_009809 [Elasticomyces elasticus]
MKKTFARRGVPRKVGEDDEPAGLDAPEPAVKRPTIKPRKSTNLRKTFNVDEDDDEETTAIAKPKRSNVAKIAIQRNAALRAVELPRRSEDEGEDSRPSYDTASLNELKASTPATPRDFASADESEAALQDVSQATRELDLSSKFGSSLARYQQPLPMPSAIPSATEIAEKKARRARLAKEQAAEEYISLDPDDPNLDNSENEDSNVMTDTNGRLVLKPKDKWNESESRLVKEDEDILENFEDFTEDGKVHIGRKAEKEAAKRRKNDMAAQIAAAEGSDSDASFASDSSEKNRIAAYEASQSRHGTYAAMHNATPEDPYAHMRPKTPPKITAIPTLDAVVERLTKQVAEMQSSRARKLQEMSELQRKKVHLAEEEVRIQKALKETAEKFETMRREKGIVGEGAPAVDAPAGLLTGAAGQDDGVREEKDDVEMLPKEDVDEEETAGADVGAIGSAGMGLGFSSMSATPGLGTKVKEIVRKLTSTLRLFTYNHHHGVTMTERSEHEWGWAHRIYNLDQDTFTKREPRPHEYHAHSFTGEPLLLRNDSRSRIENEYLVLQYLRQHTDIPVPEPINYTVEDGAAILTTSRVLGAIEIDDCAEADRAQIVEHVEKELHEKILPQLQNLKSRRMGGLTADDQLVIPPFIGTAYERGSFFRRPPGSREAEAEFVLCHNDLSRSNIMVDPKTFEIKAIIDWEYAGYFPPEFELKYWRYDYRQTDWKALGRKRVAGIFHDLYESTAAGDPAAPKRKEDWWVYGDDDSDVGPEEQSTVASQQLIPPTELPDVNVPSDAVNRHQPADSTAAQ